MHRLPLVQGHRGARFEAPENTVSGFRYAVSAGFDGVEFDIRMSSDHQLIVIHDERIDRTTNGTGRAADLTVHELQQFDACAVFADWPEPCVIPTFDQVLDVVADLPEITVEIKSDETSRLNEIVPRVVETVLARNLANKVTITSFNTTALSIAQRIAPDISRGLTGRWDDVLLLEQALSLNCRRADAHFRYSEPKIVAKAKAQGLQVMCWTVDSAQDLAIALNLEPDIICSNKPSHIRALLAEATSLTVSQRDLTNVGPDPNGWIESGVPIDRAQPPLQPTAGSV